MSGFQFPPPPPPPPRNFGNFDNQHSNQFGDLGRGRGRGRGRGGNDGRGRGARGGRGGSNDPRGNNQRNPTNNFRPRNDNSDFRPPHGGHGLPNSRPNPHAIASLPAGSYVNPAFHFGHSSPGSSVDSPQRTAAGHKRKLDALRGPQPVVISSNPVAPSVPIFGTPVVTTAARRPLSAPSKHVLQKKRTTNVLGLTPAGEPDYSASESDRDDDDVDEEAMFAELGAALTFEHNGTVLSLNSAADLAAWKKERSKNFPTRARTAMKLEEKRQIGGERRRMLLDASAALRKARSAKDDASKSVDSKANGSFVQSKPETKLEKVKRELALQTERLEGLRKHVAKSEALAVKLKAQKAAKECSETRSSVATANAPLEEDLVNDQVQEDVQVAGDEDAAAGSSSSSESSVISSDSSDSSDDDDEPPEQLTSKPPPEVPGAVKQLCSFYVASGRCRDGDACRFRHELPERGTGDAYREAQDQQQQRRQPKRDPHAPPELATIERKSIFQRMMEQEHGGEDQLALQVIKHLGKVNFFAPQIDSNDVRSDSAR